MSWEWLARFGREGSVAGLPPDLASNVDRYLYGGDPMTEGLVNGDPTDPELDDSPKSEPVPSGPEDPQPTDTSTEEPEE